MSMERCQSAPAGPVLEDSDYYVPCHGVGETGHAKKTLLGPMSKDSGEFSSRINQIIRQAGKYPGPGKYVAHTEWKGNYGTHAGNKFSNGSREWRSLAKGPDPRHYERKDMFGDKGHDFSKEPVLVSNASKDNLSKNPRILHGRIPKGKKRSFLDQAIRHSEGMPAPGHYYAKDMTKAQVLSNKMNPRSIKMTEWKYEMQKSESRLGKKPEEIGPNHYNPKWNQCEDKEPYYSVPKEPLNNFLDKAVREKMTSTRPKPGLPIPGPGTYNMQNFPLHKTSRGTFHAQLKGLSRCPVSGYL